MSDWLCKINLLLFQLGPCDLLQLAPSKAFINRVAYFKYRKFPKYSDTQKICCNHSKIWTVWLYHRVMSKRCSLKGKQCRPRSDCSSSRSSLIWVCTVCSDLSVRKLRIITIISDQFIVNGQCRKAWRTAFRSMFIELVWVDEAIFSFEFH